MEAITVAVVPHTHWDREWYATFETFRGRLVELLDRLLTLLDSDPGYAHFLLDGQLAAVDDYLAVRPEAEDRLRRLVLSGRVEVGPWYTLPDEFCVSGETLVRDLELGLARAARLGGAMEVGYLPDMFGHVAQMAQILRLFGFDRAVVWRGVPAAVDRTRFWWSAPDGSTLRAEYLWWGYGVGASIERDGPALAARLRKLIAELGDARSGPLLFTNGTDHEAPQPWLAEVIASAAADAPDLRLTVSGLAEALAGGPTAPSPGDGLPTWQGEMRSGARANLLMGVLSNRVDVKAAAAAAERALEREAEPLSAIWLPPERWPTALLAEAWLAVIRNAAHDSSCACSHDEVCAAVLARYRSARGTADALTRQALAAVAALPASPGLVVVNPTARTRGAVIEVDLPGEGPAGDAQVIDARPSVVRDEVLGADAAREWLSGWRSQDLGDGTYTVGVDIGSSPSGAVALTLRCSKTFLTNLLVTELRDRVLGQLGDAGLHLRIVQDPVRRVVCRVEGVPALGWAMWAPAPMAVPPVQVTDGQGAGAVLSNGLVSVRTNDVVRLVESGDHGDTYNYCPPDHDGVVDRPSSTAVTVLESGPARGRVLVVSTYDWPESVDGHRRVGIVPTDVSTVVELRAGERWVRVTHRWDNRSRDHRVRAVLALPAAATTSVAECAFGVVERGLRGEGGPAERAMATFPSRRFVRAGGLTVVHDGLLEYELTGADGLELDANAETASTLALTLLRSTGMLSRVDVPYRPLAAGPPLPTPGAQLQGPVTATFAVCFDAAVDPYAMADEVLVPLRTVRCQGGGPVTASSTTGLSVSGAAVSAVRREAGAVSLRVFNPSSNGSTVTVEGRSGWEVDLRGRPLRPFAESLDLGPWQIATLRLDAGIGGSG